MEWILPMEERVNMIKGDAVDLTVWDAEPDAERIALDLGGATEKVKVSGAIYTPWCLTPYILMGTRLLRTAWGILCKGAQIIRIFNACAPLWDWMRVQWVARGCGEG